MLFNKNASVYIGYAPEYLDAIQELINKVKPGLFIFSTKKLIKIRNFVVGVIGFYDLDKKL